ncbi:hypothetical protein TB147_17440 [Klebsiella aerogenes]|uniref:hypothetical protein n=1 Tax=Klebsiella aerogenes TaxID=548 RepID=UPI002E30C608|nr:hypothetical protein [Klebsiella aerogenes]MED7793095.1 hypothetical protein [Klebsiella aerogenes]
MRGNKAGTGNIAFETVDCFMDMPYGYLDNMTLAERHLAIANSVNDLEEMDGLLAGDGD